MKKYGMTVQFRHARKLRLKACLFIPQPEQFQSAQRKQEGQNTARREQHRCSDSCWLDYVGLIWWNQTNFPKGKNE